jgi:hypothetical protein
MDQISNSEYGGYIALFGLAVIVILVLLGVVWAQNRKIKDLQTPKYGFLGKPLGLLLMSVVALSGLGVYLYAVSEGTEVQESTADTNYEIVITYTPLNSTQYRITATPYLNDQAWAGDPTLQADIFWTITNTQSVTLYEYEVSLNSPSNLVANLSRGQNVVKATLFFEDETVEETTTIIVE